MLAGVALWPAVAGLVVGGSFAAPFAAYVTSRLPTRALLVLVGSVLTRLSIYNLPHPPP